jgi:hypothetical protein
VKTLPIIIFIACVLFFPSLAPSQSNPNSGSAPVTPIDFNIKDVRPGAEYDEVISRLGRPPRRRMVEIDSCGVSTQLALYYPGLTIYLDKGLDKKYGVVSIEITGTQWLVAPNIVVGSGMQAVRRELGPSFTNYRENGMTILGYITRDNDLGDLFFRNGRLAKIKLWINPC